MILLVTASSAAARVGNTAPITTIHMILIAVFAALVIAGILWGAKQKRARVAAEQDEAERAEALTAHPATAPAPPPLGDGGMETAHPPAAPVEAVTTPAAPDPAPFPASMTPLPAPEDAPARAANAPAKSRPKPAAASGYELIAVKGLGPKAVPLLAGLGITTLADLADLSDARATEIDGQLGTLSGRMMRDRWVEQARLLNGGHIEAFERVFGKL